MTLRNSQTRGCSKRQFQPVDAEAISRHPPTRLFNPFPWPHDPAKGGPMGLRTGTERGFFLKPTQDFKRASPPPAGAGPSHGRPPGPSTHGARQRGASSPHRDDPVGGGDPGAVVPPVILTTRRADEVVDGSSVR